MENISEPKLIYFRYHPADRIRDLPNEPLEHDNLVFVLDGEIQYYIDGEPTTVRGGYALYMKKGTYRRRDDSDGVARYYSALIDGGDPSDTANISTVFQFSGVSGIMWCLSMIDRTILSHSDEQDISARRVVLLSALLLNLCVEASLGTVDSPYVEAAIAYIRENYNKTKLHISDIANHVHLNSSYLSTVFRRKTGTTIGEFITKYRLDIARDELSRGSTVRETGELVGFTDPYNFSKWFRKNAGMPPSEYRARLRLGM